jgi:hypothetical protein
VCPNYPISTYGEMMIDGPTETEVRLYAALSVSVLALELIADAALDDPRSTAVIALEHLRERYAVDLHRH